MGVIKQIALDTSRLVLGIGQKLNIAADSIKQARIKFQVARKELVDANEYEQDASKLKLLLCILGIVVFIVAVLILVAVNRNWSIFHFFHKNIIFPLILNPHGQSSSSSIVPALCQSFTMILPWKSSPLFSALTWSNPAPCHILFYQAFTTGHSRRGVAFIFSYIFLVLIFHVNIYFFLTGLFSLNYFFY